MNQFGYNWVLSVSALGFIMIFSQRIFADLEEVNLSTKLQELVVKRGDLDELESSFSQRLNQQFSGLDITEELLQEIKIKGISYLQSQGDFASTVVFPEQIVSSGVVLLEVIPSQVRSVKVEGNKWASDSFYLKRMPLAVEAPLDTNQLLNEVAWANRNPFQYTEVLVTPSAQSAYIDVDFLVKDRWVLRPFAGSDNTGTNLTNQTRLYAGVSWGRPFGRPDLFTYQYTAAPNPHEFYAHSGSYLLFLPWKHELLFFGGFSASHPNLGPDFTNNAISVQTSLRYNIPIKPLYKNFKKTATWGLDYKNFNSNVFFIEASPAVPVVAHQANISQFYLSYAIEDRYSIRGEILFSPVRWLPNQSDQVYGQLRPHATVHYVYGRLFLTDVYGAGEKFSFAWTLRAQGASGPLLPSEQFSLGGYNTVRGYKERDFLADNAVCFNGEIRAHKISFFRKDELIFLTFSDFGYGINFDSEQGSQKDQYLWSLGIGARYQVASYVSLRADYGFQLHPIFEQNALGMFHLGGAISY